MLIRAGEAQIPLSNAPDVLEVGFGDGRFTAQIAQMNPGWKILGVEIAAASVSRALKRLRREKIGNVQVYHGEAEFALRNFAAPRSLSRVYVNFPDPWPKAKHEENRLLQRSFFNRLSTRLAAGGQLLLTTDHQEYWQFAQAQGQASGLFDIQTPAPPDFHLTTKYALKWKGQGRSFYHAVFTKMAESTEAWPPIQRYPMSHALMTGILPEIQQFPKAVVHFDGGTAVLLEAAKPLDQGYLFLTHIEEEDLIQDVLLEARRSSSGFYVGISRFGAPLNTAGVKAAVEWLVGWFEGQGLKVIQRSY